MNKFCPSDTRDIVESEIKFSLPFNENNRRDLNREGTLSRYFRDQFQKNKIDLSNNARVWVGSRDRRWLVTDGQRNFPIKKENNNLNVYERPVIENCALELHHFLEIDSPGNIKDIDFPRYIRPPESHIINHLRQRQTTQLQEFLRQGTKLHCVDATVDWRLIVGLGGEHVQETNMTLHHIYGIPYIPGSAVKGVLRHWWLQENEDFLDKNGEIDEDKALKNADFLAVFGSQERQGKVQFLDAYPKEVQFATDIMNPHYGEYYSGSKPPTDHQRLVPINFLTVEKTAFRFVFLAKEQEHLDHLKVRFKNALEIKGVGAKTSVGYGYFRDFEDQTNDIIDDLKRKQEEVKEQQEAERIASLSPIEQLAEELHRLTDQPVDEDRAVQIYKEQLPSLVDDDKHIIAQALKAYWQRINKWDGGSDKQRQKVMVVKTILDES